MKNSVLTRTIILLPLPILFLLFLEGMGHVRVSSQQEAIGYFVANSIFLNSVHLVFSLILARSNPDFRIVLSHHFKNKWLLFVIPLFIVLSLLFHYNDAPSLQNVVQYLVGLFALYHGWAQFRGLEKSIFQTYQWSQWTANITSSCDWFIFAALVLTYTDVSFGQKMNIPLVIYFGMVMVALVIKWVAARTNRTELFQYVLFSTRYIPLSLIPYLSYAGIGQAAIHGSEYSLVVFGILKGTKTKLKTASSFFLVAVVLFPLIIGGDRSLLGVLGYSNYIPQSYLAAVPLTFLALVHYYLDGVFFKFKNPFVREKISPILKLALRSNQ